MNKHAVALGFALALVGVALVIFVVEAVHELSYASGHPYAYGPAKVIAAACAAGALLSLAIALLTIAFVREARPRPTSGSDRPG